MGDWVAILTQPTGQTMIEAVLPRRTNVTRKTAWQEADEQVLVANVDTLFIVSDLDRDLSARRLERYVAVAYESGAEPVVVLTKLDLCRDRRLILEAEAVAIGLAVLAVSNVTGEGLDQLERFLRPGRTVGLIGSSGVGKSTLINRLAGAELFPTAAVRRDGRGRHTTRHRELIALPSGALLVDTPGLRELQLWDGDLDEAFSDLAALAERCRFSDCAHVSEPDCAVLAAIVSGELDGARLDSYRKLERGARGSRRTSQPPRLGGAEAALAAARTRIPPGAAVRRPTVRRSRPRANEKACQSGRESGRLQRCARFGSSASGSEAAPARWS